MTVPDWISVANIALTSLAIIAAPIVALWIGGKIQLRTERRRAKLTIFGVLIALRHEPISTDAVRALNTIDVVFSDDFKVREAWGRYYNVLNDINLNNPIGFAIREEKRRELLLEMVRVLDISGQISSADLLRTYLPTGQAEVEYFSRMERQVKSVLYNEELAKRGLPTWPALVPTAGTDTPNPTSVPPTSPVPAPTSPSAKTATDGNPPTTHT